MSRRVRIGMVALGLIPALHMAVSFTPVLLAAFGVVAWNITWLSPVLLFFVPPLVVRLITLSRPLAVGRIDPCSPEFLRWWCAAQWQVVFSRLPLLEELLRLVPGLYSMWLRLWGARIGSLVYWSPGVAVLDRPLLEIGSRVVFGVGVRLNGHVLAPDSGGRTTLHLGPISIGDDVLVGGYSLLLPGCVIADREVTPPFRSLHAFCRYERGRRTSVADKASNGVAR